MQEDKEHDMWTTAVIGRSVRGLNLRGTDNGDTIAGSGNSDEIIAGAGPDVVTANAGNDIVYGGAGADSLIGDAGADLLYGGEDEGDVLYGGSGPDTLFGDAGGRDSVYGGDGNDIAHTGSGDEDVLFLGPGDDEGFGGPGFGDQLFGGIGNDTLRLVEATPGTLGDSLLYGNSGDDLIEGSPFGEALLSGGLGTDTIFGFSGDDRLNVHFGDGASNTLWGGEGLDEFNVQANGTEGGYVLIGDWERSETLTIDLEPGQPTPRLDAVTYDGEAGTSTFVINATDAGHGMLRVEVPGDFTTSEYFQTIAGAEGEDIVFYNGPGPEEEDDFLGGFGPLLLLFLIGAGGFLAYNRGVLF